MKYIKSFATFSEDKKHRFVLCRQWSEKPCAMVIGLNPSTADDKDDDPTIGFVTRILDHNGYGGLFMVNLFTMITPYPKELILDEDHEKAISIWRGADIYSDVVIFAWGRFKIPYGRDETAKRMFKDALCFGHLKNGEPRHPMYLKNNTVLVNY